MESNHEESYRRIMEYQEEQHRKNQKRIRWGIRCVILIPLVFLMLMFSMDSSKVIFLVLWIASLFAISAYLIYVEYTDYTIQAKLAELGIKEDGKIDELLPNISIDSRLAEMERKLAEERALISRYLTDAGFATEEPLLDDKGGAKEEPEPEDEPDGDAAAEKTGEDKTQKKEKKSRKRKKGKEDGEKTGEQEEQSE